MVNKPLIRPYFLGGIALGGVARIPMIKGCIFGAADGGRKQILPLKRSSELRSYFC